MKTHPRHPRRPRLARCGALALLALLAACESTLPSGYSTHDDVGKFIGGLTRTYATGQRVTISFYGEQSQSEDLAVESSDPALLKPIADLDGALEVEGAGPCLGEALCEAPAGEGAPPEAQGAGGVVRQRFELVGEGAASLVFKDGGEVVREVPIRLVKATRVEAHVYYGGAAAKLGGDTRLADGARFVAGRAHKIQLIPYLNDKPLYLSELLTPPTTAGATLEHTYTPLWREGVVLEVRPEALAGDAAEGRPFSLRAALAGVDYALSLQAAPPSAVRDLVVRISRDAPESRVGDDGVTTEVPVAIAFAQGRDEAGAPVYGAEVVWERADGSERVEGSALRFEYSDSAPPVPFTVTSGATVESVALPMNPSSMILSSDSGYRSCRAAGGGAALPPLVTLALALALARRRRAA